MKEKSTFNHYLEMYEEGFLNEEETINRANEFCVLYIEAIMAEKSITDKDRIRIIENVYADYRTFKDEMKIRVDLDESEQRSA